MTSISFIMPGQNILKWLPIFFLLILVSDPMMLQLPMTPSLISALASTRFPSPTCVFSTQLLMPNTLQLPIFMTLSFSDVGLNMITARYSMTLQSPKIILKCYSFFSQIMEQVGFMMQPQPKTTFPTISFSPRFSTFAFFSIHGKKYKSTRGKQYKQIQCSKANRQDELARIRISQTKVVKGQKQMR